MFCVHDPHCTSYIQLNISIREEEPCAKAPQMQALPSSILIRFK